MADAEASGAFEALLRSMNEEGASDLILTAGAPPQLRIRGLLHPVSGNSLTAQHTEQLARELLSEAHFQELLTRRNIDVSRQIEDLGRYRVNAFFQKDAAALVLRRIPEEIPSFEALGLPPVVEEFANRPHGLVLITGPAGQGKSTTMASMIDYVNRRRHVHIVCIEDPIEYVHHHHASLVEQREILQDALSFDEALRSVFRQSPDIIMVGEMRDLETIRLALNLAETGHLILATLHTHDTTNAINRIASVFPSHEQQQVFTQLSMSLVGIIAQVLLPTADNTRLVLAYEVLKMNAAVANLIRENHIQQIYSVIQTGRAEGMCTMNDSLVRLWRAGLIEKEKALERSPRQQELLRMLHGTGPTGHGRGGKR